MPTLDTLTATVSYSTQLGITYHGGTGRFTVNHPRMRGFDGLVARGTFEPPAPNMRRRVQWVHTNAAIMDPETKKKVVKALRKLAGD